MTSYSWGDASPRIAPTAFIAPTATLIGDVEVLDEASVWFGAVVRADNDSIRIGPRSNLQDGVMAHVDPGSPLLIGAGCTVGHGAILHGCTIGDGALVGMGARVLNGARIGAGSLIAAGAVVPPGMEIPGGHLAAGVPARVVRSLRPSDPDLQFAYKSYVESARQWRSRSDYS